MDLETSLASTLDAMGTNLDQASPEQLFCALLRVTRDVELKQKPAQGDRKLYYFSAEFLIGMLLRANLQNLGLLDDAERILAEHGTSLAEVEDRELEPSLGNGGLGRLAACFLDSIASLGLPGDGVGLNYHFGLFRQDLSQGVQLEKPNPWIEPDSWLIETGSSFTVPFGSGDLSARSTARTSKSPTSWAARTSISSVARQKRPSSSTRRTVTTHGTSGNTIPRWPRRSTSSSRLSFSHAAMPPRSLACTETSWRRTTSWPCSMLGTTQPPRSAASPTTKTERHGSARCS